MLSPSSPGDDLGLIQHGLPRSGATQKVLVLGAGMAGLSAAYELMRAGHEVEVLEAQTRVGGRVFTMREPFSHGLYGEAGAMRIPRAHALTMAYVEKFGLSTFPFRMGNPRALCCLMGLRLTLEEAERDPDRLGFELAESERGLTSAALWARALRPLAARLEAESGAAWSAITEEYDSYSVREFLESQGWSEGAIERFGLLANQEALMNSSFLELLREEVGNYYTDMVQLEGGMDRLAAAFLPHLGGRIRFGCRVVAIEQKPDEVWVHYRTAAGRYSARAARAIVTLPTPLLRHIEFLPSLSRPKMRAIRQLHYDASAKIFLQCRRRFWEEDDGIFGGGTVTDLAVRNIYYPEHGRDTGRGVLLASYTWSEDAQRWGSLSPSERVEQALEDVARIHPSVRDEFEAGASKMWHDDEFAGGAFALFDPGQQTLLHDAVRAPEGRLHFAGEHTSLAHAWIQGAIESGLRAAREVHLAPPAPQP